MGFRIKNVKYECYYNYKNFKDMKIYKPKERSDPILSKKFRKIYKVYILPILKKYLNSNKCYLPVAYTIYAGRNRFRSGIPFLLSQNKSIGAAIGAVSELMWGVCLIYDDLGDESEFRRGKLTAWKNFGNLYALHSAALGFPLARRILDDYNLDKKIKNILEESFKLTIESQIEQSLFTLKVSSDNILENYKKKGTLGNWSIRAITFTNNTNNNLSSLEKKNIIKFSNNLSVAAQIKNDILDFLYNSKTELCMRDVRFKVPTYPIILFMEQGSKKDKKYFIDYIWGNREKSLKSLQEECLKVFSNFNVLENSENKIKDLIEEAIDYIKNIKDDKVKEVLVNWAFTYLKT